MKELFRKNALADINSPEQLSKYIRVVTPSAWSAALALFGAALGLLIWAFTGSFITVETAYGVVFPEGGVVNVNAVASGYISNLRVKPGDYVEAGDLLVVMPQDGITDEINRLRNQGADGSRIEELIGQYAFFSFLFAKHSGRITKTAEERSYVEIGESVATILVHEKGGIDLQVLAFVPSAAAKNLKPGMEAQISPLFAAREEYGYMQGYISSMDSYPVTREYINDGMLAFVGDILPENGFIQVVITLLYDAESDNLIRWSNDKGRHLPVDAGTTCKILIITDKSKPADRFLNGGGLSK